jgi:subtilisin family serine protease
MRILIRPREGIREPDIDRSSPTYRRKRLEWRQAEIDALWQRLALELSLTNEARALGERKMLKLPAVGMLVIDDSVATLERLRHMNWLIAYLERPLPRPMLSMPLSTTGASTAWHLTMIKKPSTLAGKPVSIGVIDYGCDPLFSDLAGFAPKFKHYDTATLSLITAAPTDGSLGFHGSKVCSLLAGSKNGVAPQAMYLVAGVLADDGYETTQITMAAAFDWLLSENTGAPGGRDIGCDIITTSLLTNEYKTPDSGDVEACLTAAEDAGTLVVAAIGNGGAGNWQPPGSFPTVVAAGAVDVNRDVAYFSADGKPTAVVSKPDILAPGLAIEWPWAAGGGFDVGEGTSFSAPIVAGAAALILEKRPILRDDIVKFRNTVLSFVSPSSSQGTVRGGRGICDLQGL